ncbi:hypothetical protein [Actinoplanes sp. N902-109]|uniref:hypothetical protein n=1 Tax=Actinoplanes sp. (strain N902-109) TaxID=649831 RepID=UPI0003294F81|nr:hypothetical protein [Actinoplanes sp. N902-109]AGL16528.1 hypothetical protein L083_3018 [Actinoplanes sp. N902-109]
MLETATSAWTTTPGVAETHELSLTTQGPLYPPSEVMDADGNFVVVGMINRAARDGATRPQWGAAVVSPDSPLPAFGALAPYTVIRELDTDPDGADRDLVLYTLPLPLPCNNYPMVFAPEQLPEAARVQRPSHAFHEVPIPDLRAEDGPKLTAPVTFGAWMRASGSLTVAVTPDGHRATFGFQFSRLIPDSVYTVMSLRARDLDPAGPTRPGPLGVPNVFVTDAAGNGSYRATLPDPFPDPARPGANRIINVVVLWMSYQRSYGGAIGEFGLGGDIHAHLKLRGASFQSLRTTAAPQS